MSISHETMVLIKNKVGTMHPARAVVGNRAWDGGKGCSQAPRARVNRKGHSVIGGKIYRKAMKTLEARREARDKDIADFSRSKPGIAAMRSNVPGSMTK